MKTYICVAQAGGQGKTTVAQALFRTIRQQGEPYKLVSADFCDDLGRSKLGKFYPGKVTELGIGAELTSAKADNDPNAALKYWDRFGQMLLEGGSIIDIGANVVSPLKQWAQHRNAHKILHARNAAPIDILLVCKAERHAVQDIAELVRSIQERQFVPASSVTVVLNEFGGNFDKIDVRKAIADVAPKSFVRYIRLPRCTSELWPRLEQTYTSVDRALSMSEESIADLLDIDVWSASAGLIDLKSWASEVDKEFRLYLDAFTTGSKPESAPAKVRETIREPTREAAMAPTAPKAPIMDMSQLRKSIDEQGREAVERIVEKLEEEAASAA